MKRGKPTGLRSNDKNVKPSKKLKVRITSDDQSPSKAGQSKEANNTPVYPSGRVTRAKAGGETSEATKSISNGKKTPARKKGETSADNKGQKTLPEGTLQRLQALIVHLSGENDPPNPEAEIPQSFAPLSPETTDNHEDTEANADTTVRRETETPIKRQAKLPETPVDGFNWTKYGQKLVKGDAFARSYYKCTYANCLARKQVKLSHDGHSTEVKYISKHEHPKPPQNQESEPKEPSLTVEVTMADINAPDDQAPAIPPPTRTNDQILPHANWASIGKSNCYLDVGKIQQNPIYKLAVDILKQTNFFRAFTACSSVPSIYIQQFWDTVHYDKDTARFSCQLDEQWFDLNKDIIRDALQITPVDVNKPFTSPPALDNLINFVNDLGYPKAVSTLSSVITNDMYQPWRAILTIINLCLTGKTSGYERARAPVLQILWGIVNGANIDYAEKIWEEFTQSIHSFILHKVGKKRINCLVIPSVRFTKMIIFHLQSKHQFNQRLDSPLHLPDDEHVLRFLKFTAKGSKHEVFGKAIPEALITSEILNASYYQDYLKKVDKHQKRYLAREQVSDAESPAPKPSKSTKPHKSTKHSKPKPKKRKEASTADKQQLFQQLTADQLVPVAERVRIGETNHCWDPSTMDEDEEIDWDAAIDEGMEHVMKENIEGEKERFSENKGGTSMTSLGNEEYNSEDNEGMDEDEEKTESDNHNDDDDDDDDDDRSYRWVRRNEKKQTPNPTSRRSTKTTSREPVVTVSVHEQPPSPPPRFIPKTTSIQKAPPNLKSPIPTPEPTTQELDETSFVTVAQMKTVMSTAIAHVNEQIEKAVADQFKKYLASQPTSQPTTSSTPHPNTSGPTNNYKDFEFEELKQMMLAHMLDQPELRNAKPALFGYLYRGADLEHPCTTDVLRKRLHDDPDNDNH